MQTRYRKKLGGHGMRALLLVTLVGVTPFHSLAYAQTKSATPSTHEPHGADPSSAQKPGAVRGIVRGIAEVTLAADIAARVTRAPLKDGDRFKRGELLLEFDCAQLEAEADAARAAHRGHRNTYESNIQLRKLGAGGQFAVRAAKADMEKADAEVRRLEARMRACRIEAPFDGRIVERVVSAFETPGLNQPLVRVVDDSELELQLVVPSRWLSWLKAGAEFSFAVDETRKTHRARLNVIGAIVDPVSQTVRLRGAFVERPDEILAGMSGTAQFEAPREIAGTR